MELPVSCNLKFYSVWIQCHYSHSNRYCRPGRQGSTEQCLSISKVHANHQALVKVQEHFLFSRSGWDLRLHSSLAPSDAHILGSQTALGIAWEERSSSESGTGSLGPLCPSLAARLWAGHDTTQGLSGFIPKSRECRGHVGPFQL